MALNIKNPETDRLARELAELCGMSITDVLTAALKEKLGRERDRRSSDRLSREIHRIRERYIQLPVADDRTADQIIGYDDVGLPR